MEYANEANGCTITVLSPNFTESAIPSGLHNHCGASRSISYRGPSSSMTTEISDENSEYHLGYSVDTESKTVTLHFPNGFLNQSGSYQCTILRNCDPGIIEPSEDK